MSSSSSIASSADSRASSKSKISSCDLNDENNDPLESDFGSEGDEDDDNSEFNSSMFDSFTEEVEEEVEEPEEFLETKPEITEQKAQKTLNKNYDTEDPFNMYEMFSSDADPFDFNIKSDQNDSGISLNSTNTFIKKEPVANYIDSFDLDQLIKTENKSGFESDDSDCLFSITKSVSIQSLMNNTGKKKIRLTSEQRKKRLKEAHKRKKSGLKNSFHENEDDEDDEFEEIEENKNVDKKTTVTNSSELLLSDDELTTSIKRPKTESSDINDNSFTVSFLIEKIERVIYKEM
jgi:hypothetical protein